MAAFHSSCVFLGAGPDALQCNVCRHGALELMQCNVSEERCVLPRQDETYGALCVWCKMYAVYLFGLLSRSRRQRGVQHLIVGELCPMGIVGVAGGRRRRTES